MLLEECNQANEAVDLYTVNINKNLAKTKKAIERMDRRLILLRLRNQELRRQLKMYVPIPRTNINTNRKAIIQEFD